MGLGKRGQTGDDRSSHRDTVDQGRYPSQCIALVPRSPLSWLPSHLPTPFASGSGTVVHRTRLPHGPPSDRVFMLDARHRQGSAPNPLIRMVQKPAGSQGMCYLDSALSWITVREPIVSECSHVCWSSHLSTSAFVDADPYGSGNNHARPRGAS